MKKNILSFALVISVMVSLFALFSITANAETEGIYKYTVENGEATFTGFNESVSGEVVIPSTLGGYPVTTIGTNAFFSYNQPISVTIPASVTTIKDIKFHPSSLAGINVDEENPNYSSEGGVLFNKDKTVLLRYPEMKSKGTYIVPDSVTEIGAWAFSFCPSITGITLPEGLISIGESAFEVCGYLPSITIPESVTSIGIGAFKVCVSLTDINVAEGNPNYSSENGVLFNKDKTTLIQYPAAKYDEEYTIPESVTTIGDWALSYCQSSAITIPNSVTIIGDSAFRFCNNITDIVIPDSVTSIIDYAFYGCENLIDVTIPGSVTSIGEYAFYTCDSLINVTIPEGVISLEKASFGYCENLTSITIPASVTGDVKSAIRDCEKLTRIDVDENNLNYSSVDGVLFNKDKTILVQYPMGKSDTIYYIPDGVTSIERNAFERCKNLISVVIPDGVTIIDENAFWGCESLTNIRIPASVTIIAEDAFSGWENLTDVYYGGTRSEWNAIDIGSYNYALEYADIYYECKHPWDCITYTVENGEATITRCDDVRNDFIMPTTLGGYPVTTIGENAFWKSYRLTSITIADSVKTIGEYAFSDSYNLTSVIISDSVTDIGKGAFSYCDSLESITIPDSVISIGSFAFNSCESLTTVTISAGLESIGEGAFDDCESLANIDVVENNSNFSSEDGILFNKDKTKIIIYPIAKDYETYDIPDSVTSISERAFRNCSLTGITIPDGMTSIDKLAFSGCRNLTNIALTDNVTSIGDYAFAWCTSLSDFTIPDSITSIGEYAFTGCMGLTDVTIPSGVTSISDYTFYDCDNLTNVTIPVSVTSIGEWAFASCANLKDVYYGGTEQEWKAIDISSVNGLYQVTIHYTYEQGDADGDGEVSVKDVISIRRFIAGGYEGTIFEEVADVNKDGEVGVKDIITIRRFIAGGYGVEL